ncbi:MAG: hypothetical protein R3A13_02695 [Bdellovibrionota bacterium]
MNDEVLYTTDLVKDLTLTKTGEWLHEAKPFENKKLKALFFRSIEWVEAEQKYYLRIGKGRAAFNYEDTVYFVQNIETEKKPWMAKLSDGSREKLNLGSLSIGDSNQLYCLVKGSHKARFSRSSHQLLLEYVVDDEHVEINGVTYDLTQD